MTQDNPTPASEPSRAPQHHGEHHAHSHQPAGGPALTFLRISALLTALGGLAQLVMGIMLAMGNEGPESIHGTVGLVTMILGILAGVAAARWSSLGGNTGMRMHALTVSLLGVLQYGLGEMMSTDMGGGAMRTVHMIIGLVFVIAAVALATLAYRKPYAANPHGALNESTHHED